MTDETALETYDGETPTDTTATMSETDSDHETADSTDSQPETTRDTGALTGPRATEYDPVEVYEHMRHRNGDETVVLLTSFGNGYQALAFDVDGGGQLLDVEDIGDETDRETVVGMCEYWLKQNPDGIWGGSEDTQGFLEKLGLGGGQ